MVLRISDLPIVGKNELSDLNDKNTLFEISTRGDGYDSWKSKSMTFGDLKQQVVLSVATLNFELSGDKIFNDNVTVEGDLKLSGSVILEGERPEQNIFHVTTRNNTLSAIDENRFYGTANRFFGDVVFHDLSDTNAEVPMLRISNGSLSAKNDITCTEMHGIASSARWGDLAELYVADADYEPGTLIRFGGEKEITVASDGEVNGVVTSRPGVTINSALQDSSEEYVRGVALVGRVPVRVNGKVKRFDSIRLSDMNGVGVASEDKTAIIVGRALESKDTDGVGTVECVVKLTL